jgi:hypothetical protein
MSDAGAPVARFDFRHGPQRGSSLTLHAGCLVHRGDFDLETIPLGAIAAARVDFVRDSRSIGWGVVLLLAALVLWGLSAPLAGFAAAAAEEMAGAGAQGMGRALGAAFRVLEALANLLPILGVASALGGIGLAVLGWYGHTTLTIAIPGFERAYPVRGRNGQLLDFNEALCERLMAARK